MLDPDDIPDANMRQPLRRQKTPAWYVQYHTIGLVNALVNYIRTLELSPLRNVTPRENSEEHTDA